jgi:hypothetical protein
MEDLSAVFGKDDFDNDNRGYVETFRFGINLELGFGTRRQFSVVMAESGMYAEYIPRLALLDFVIEYHTATPYAVKYHGLELVTRGVLTIAQVNSIMGNLGNADSGSEFSMTHATKSNGVKVTIRIVNLRQGKKNERVELNEDGKLVVRETTKNFERLPKAYKRNRRQLQ